MGLKADRSFLFHLRSADTPNESNWQQLTVHNNERQQQRQHCEQVRSRDNGAHAAPDEMMLTRDARQQAASEDESNQEPQMMQLQEEQVQNRQEIDTPNESFKPRTKTHFREYFSFAQVVMLFEAAPLCESLRGTASRYPV